LSLPVALVAEIGISVIPFTCFATWSLFGILQIGYMIEDPFQSSINLDVITETIRDDINELLFINNLQLTNPIV
jgi:predicted membrane chloride channel (bestrophin family)